MCAEFGLAVRTYRTLLPLEKPTLIVRSVSPAALVGHMDNTSHKDRCFGYKEMADLGDFCSIGELPPSGSRCYKSGRIVGALVRYQ